MKAGLGKAELELVTSFCAPLYWVIVKDGEVTTRNGTAFFLDAGEGLFAVTAAHVIDGWRKTPPEQRPSPLRLGGNGESLRVDLADRLIDECTEIDIATFSVSADEVRRLGKTVLTGFQRSWPPAAPTLGRGIYYCGYPGVVTQQLSRDEVCFGAAPGGGVASSVSERDVSSMVERENLIPVFGDGLPPDNFDFRGMSGGPMLTVVQNGLRSWMLTGVIVEGPNTDPTEGQSIGGLEIFRARRAHFITPTGKLDRRRWELLTPPKRREE